MTFKHEHKFWLMVGGTILIILAAYLLWFSPNNNRDQEGSDAFAAFKASISGSISVFRGADSPDEAEPLKNPDDTGELRAKVFGDKIER